jgi:protein-L-isoaspartate O-methyltransferase
MNSIQDFRNFYARYIVGNSTKPNERLVAAFAAVERENYVGAGPWKISTLYAGYLDTISDDPRHLYQDVVIGLVPDRHINNGQPRLHALCLAACNPKSGESVLHIGVGAGYYSAILAELVGSGGTVLAYEIETDLADRARRNLSHLPNVQVVGASGCAAALPPADLIYVNASSPQPMPVWLDALNSRHRSAALRAAAHPKLPTSSVEHHAPGLAKRLRVRRPALQWQFQPIRARRETLQRQPARASGWVVHAPRVWFASPRCERSDSGGSARGRAERQPERLCSPGVMKIRRLIRIAIQQPQINTEGHSFQLSDFSFSADFGSIRSSPQRAWIHPVRMQ